MVNQRIDGKSGYVYAGSIKKVSAKHVDKVKKAKKAKKVSIKKLHQIRKLRKNILRKLHGKIFLRTAQTAVQLQLHK